jgi:rare lipoprotein A
MDNTKTIYYTMNECFRLHTAMPPIHRLIYPILNLILPIILSASLLSGCSFNTVKKSKQDGAPNVELNVLEIPNAVPKVEVISRHGNPPFYTIKGKRYYVLDSARGFKQKGIASWYGTRFHKKTTSSGEPYNMYQMTAAHKTLPLPCYAHITNLNNHKSIIVKINDRGPFHPGRIVDLSYAAAKKLDIHGIAPVILKTVPPYPYHREVPSRYYHIAVLSTYNKARALKRRLHFYLNLNVTIKTLITQSNKTVYLVRVGPLYTIKDYLTVKQLIRSKHKALKI